LASATFTRRWEPVAWPLATIVGALCVWQIGVRWSGTTVFPLPLDVVRGMGELAGKGLLLRYIADSLMRVGAGYSLAVICGIPAGLALGWYPLAGSAINPVLQMLRPISPLAWIPLAIVWFGTGNLSAIFLIFLASFFPIVVSTMNGVRNVPSMYRQAGENFGLSMTALLRRVVLPAALPQVLVGLRISLGVAWLVIVAAEMIAVNSGLGYMIIDARNAGKRYDLVIAGMIIIGLIGLALDFTIRRFERLKSVRWGFRQEGMA
jgi:NitT/TauT family transport system permease protein